MSFKEEYKCDPSSLHSLDLGYVAVYKAVDKWNITLLVLDKNFSARKPSVRPKVEQRTSTDNIEWVCLMCSRAKDLSIKRTNKSNNFMISFSILSFALMWC